MQDDLVPLPPGGQLLIYREGGLNLQVRLDGDTAWLTQRLIAELFQVTVPTVNEHLANIYNDEELAAEATIRKFRIVQTEGARQVARLVDHYNLDAILAVGYRVRSARGTAFRQWATARLSELLVKGFTLDDERIKAGRTLGDDDFDELLARIRDIRSSERMFWQKVLDVRNLQQPVGDLNGASLLKAVAGIPWGIPWGHNLQLWDNHSRCTAELHEQRKQSAKLDNLIWANLEDIGHGG